MPPQHRLAVKGHYKKARQKIDKNTEENQWIMHKIFKMMS